MPEPLEDKEPVAPVTDVERRHRVGQLFAEHNRALISFLTARLHCQHEAFDVAQEAYVRMLQLDHSVSFHKAYLFRIAQNLITDRLRRRIVREQFCEDDMLNFNLLQVEPEPDRQALAQTELDDIQARLAELPPKCRYAFEQHMYLDLSVREIAEKMQLGERMVRLYIVRALAHCRREPDAGDAE